MKRALPPTHPLRTSFFFAPLRESFRPGRKPGVEGKPIPSRPGLLRRCAPRHDEGHPDPFVVRRHRNRRLRGRLEPPRHTQSFETALQPAASPPPQDERIKEVRAEDAETAEWQFLCDLCDLCANQSELSITRSAGLAESAHANPPFDRLRVSGPRSRPTNPAQAELVEAGLRRFGHRTALPPCTV